MDGLLYGCFDLVSSVKLLAFDSRAFLVSNCLSNLLASSKSVLAVLYSLLMVCAFRYVGAV